MPSPHHRSHLNSSSLENGVWLTSNHEPAAHGRSYVGQLLDYFANSTDYSPSLLLDPPLDFNPNVPIDEDGHAALHWAAALGRIRMVGLLIESGADVLSINKAGHTALMRAVMSAVSDEFPALHRLLASSTMSRDSNHQTVLHHAMNLVLFTGETPAALHCIQTILHHLADCPAERAALLDFRNSNDETALMMASRCSSQPLFDLLAGFSINWETPEDQHSSFSGLPATRSLTPIDAASPTIMLSEPLVLAIEKRIRWAQSQGDREVSQATLDRLDQLLSVGNPSSEVYALGFQQLRRWCRTLGSLPSRCTLKETIDLNSESAFSSSALSDVYRGWMMDRAVAVKSVRLHTSERDDVLKSFRCEAATWRCLRHPNIVPFLGVSDIFPVCLISEWMSEGTISDFFRRRSNVHRGKYIEDIVNGLQYIHQLNVVHGDIKSANILVDAKLTARLTDFGIAKILYLSPTAATTLCGGAQGTYRWMAPELIEPSDEDNPLPLTIASDIYALSVTIWQLFTTQIPFPNVRHDIAVTRKVLKGERPLRPDGCLALGLNDQLWVEMGRGWSAEPHDRPPLSAFLDAVLEV